jgi:hypothetical protein
MFYLLSDIIESLIFCFHNLEVVVQKPPVLTEVASGFVQSIQSNARIILEVDHGLLPLASKFIIQKSSVFLSV